METTVKTVTLDISIDPVDMTVGDDNLSESAVLETIRTVATNRWPNATITFKTLQIGHRQGDGWAKCWIDHHRNDDAAIGLMESIDWSDPDLY